MADELGIDDACGECLPEQKLEFVQDLQRAGAVVAMVGDGINDAAVLRAADVSFAMGGGAALAQAHADAVLLSDAPRRRWRMPRGPHRRRWRVIRQNLAWARSTTWSRSRAAALGLLNPWLSGIGMSLSSPWW